MSMLQSNPYWKALQVSLAFQVAYGILGATAADGGALFQIWIFSMLAFWGIFLVILSRRRHSPTKTDLFLIRWGFPILFPFVTGTVAHFVWRLKGEISNI